MSIGILVQQLAFSAEDMSKSSTFRELKAFHLCYTNLDLLTRLANQRVKHFTDNFNLERMFKIGSKRSHLHSLLFDIFLNLKMFNITLEVVWLPRTDPTMVVADYFSRTLDTADYGISHAAFSVLSTAWGPFDVDAFASDSNARLKHFFSKLYSTSALGSASSPFCPATSPWRHVMGVCSRSSISRFRASCSLVS